MDEGHREGCSLVFIMIKQVVPIPMCPHCT